MGDLFSFVTDKKKIDKSLLVNFKYSPTLNVSQQQSHITVNNFDDSKNGCKFFGDIVSKFAIKLNL